MLFSAIFFFHKKASRFFYCGNSHVCKWGPLFLFYFFATTAIFGSRYIALLKRIISSINKCTRGML